MAAPLGALLFDVFGTLIHFGVSRAPFRTLLRGLGRERRERAFRHLLTKRAESLSDLADQLGVDSTRLHAAERELAEHLASATLAEGALTLLETIRERGTPVALVSNLASVYVPIVRELGIEGSASAAIYSCEVGVRKPDPAIFAVALSRLGVREATVVGDSLRSDVLGAEAAGLPAIWLTSEATDRPSVATLSQLLDAL